MHLSVQQQQYLTYQTDFVTMKGTMNILHIKRKAQLLNTLKCFHVFDLSRQKLQINNMLTDIHNTIFVLKLMYTHHNNICRKHPPSHNILNQPPQKYATCPWNIAFFRLHTHNGINTKQSTLKPLTGTTQNQTFNERVHSSQLTPHPG